MDCWSLSLLLGWIDFFRCFLLCREHCELHETLGGRFHVSSCPCEFYFHWVWRKGKSWYIFCILKCPYSWIFHKYLIFIGHFINGLFVASLITEFKLGPEELERWFTKVDHVFEHTRVPHVGETLSPFYKIIIDKSQLHHLPAVSHINYKWCFPTSYSLFSYV